jgi:hypothetical protein
MLKLRIERPELNLVEVMRWLQSISLALIYHSPHRSQKEK